MDERRLRELVEGLVAGDVQPDDAVAKLTVLRAHCDDVGRDYDTMTKTALMRHPVIEDPDGGLRIRSEEHTSELQSH